MGTSLEKTRKRIAKKKGPIEAIHQYSRDSKRLGRAQARDEKLGKVAAAKKKSDRPWSMLNLCVAQISLKWKANTHRS